MSYNKELIWYMQVAVYYNVSKTIKYSVVQHMKDLHKSDTVNRKKLNEKYNKTKEEAISIYDDYIKNKGETGCISKIRNVSHLEELLIGLYITN